MQCCLASVQQKGEVAKERRSENVLDNSSHASTTKTMFCSTKFAQNKGKTLCSLLVFTQLFRQEIKSAVFSLSLLRFLDHMYLCVLEKILN